MKNIILLHGALGHTSHFEAYVPETGAGHKVFTPLFSGHGGLPLPTEPLTIHHYIDELSAFIEREQLDRVHLFGHSMGGYVALNYALRNPEKVDSVITLGTKLHWTPEIAAAEEKMLDPERMEEKIPKFAAMLEQLHGHAWKNLVRSVAVLMRDLGNHPPLTPQTLSSVAVPVKIMLGSLDHMVTSEESEAAARAISGGVFKLLPDLKHPLEAADPAVILQEMDEFWGFQKSAL